MLVIPHRGITSRFTENSFGSLCDARDAGAARVEVDIRRSADGGWWLLHDPTLDRTSSATGRLGAQSSGSLSRVRLADGSALPRLEDALDLVAKDLTVCLDVKDPDPGVVRSALAVSHNVEIWSKHQAVVAAASRANLPAAYLCSGIMPRGVGATLWRARELGAARVSFFPADVEPHVSAACRNAAMPFLCGAPNDQRMWEALRSMGAWAIVTDRYHDAASWQRAQPSDSGQASTVAQ